MEMMQKSGRSALSPASDANASAWIFRADPGPSTTSSLFSTLLPPFLSLSTLVCDSLTDLPL